MGKRDGQDGSLFVQDKTMFYLESYTSPSRARASFEPHAPEFPPFYIPVECLQGWRKQSFDGRVIWLREEGSKMVGTYSCSPYLRGGADLLRLPSRKITDLTNEKHTLISV